MKAKQTALASALSQVNPAVLEATVNSVTKGHGKDNAPKTGQARSKVKAGRDWAAMGAGDLRTILHAQGEAEKTYCQIWADHLPIFVPFGWGQSKGKKRVFAEQTETYFQGAEIEKAKLPKPLQPNAGKVISQTRRVMGAFLHYVDKAGDQSKGIEHVRRILLGNGTKDQKLDALPTITGIEKDPNAPKTPRKARQPAGPTPQPSVTNTMLQAEREQRTQLVKAMKPQDYRDFLSALTPTQLVELMHEAVAILKAQPKETTAHEIGEKIEPLVESGYKAEVIPPQTSAALAGSGEVKGKGKKKVA